MSTIVWRGPWLWFWASWHVLWLAGLIWSGVVWRFGGDPRWIALYWAALYTSFLPPEIVGSVLIYRKRDGLARTLSEFRQYLPVNYGKGQRAPLSWKALGYSGVVDAAIVGWLLYPLSPLVAAVVSIVLSLWLVPHYGWRHRGG